MCAPAPVFSVYTLARVHVLYPTGLAPSVPPAPYALQLRTELYGQASTQSAALDAPLQVAPVAAPQGHATTPSAPSGHGAPCPARRQRHRDAGTARHG